MTLIQLEYLLAVDLYRHFGKAAEHCHVTQPTLSMQLIALEEELGIKLFDRSKQPVIPTETGKPVIGQARVILNEAKKLKLLIEENKGEITGELRLGIIPTLAPYLLPDLFNRMQARYPMLKLFVRELLTEDIIRELKNHRLDCALAVTPLNDPSIKEEVLFYEELFVYVSAKNSLMAKKYILADELHADQLWLLEEGHCFRSQVLNLCELRKNQSISFSYQTGNIETLKRMADKSNGVTILPELAVNQLSRREQKSVKRFKAPQPARQVSLLIHRDQVKYKKLQALKDETLNLVPQPMHSLRNKKIVEINYS